MKNKRILFSLAGLVVASFVINSCKKEDQSNIPNLFSTGAWQLASVNVYHYIGDAQESVDTLNTDCDTTQLFIFNKDMTCTYTNFDCKAQPTATGTWSLAKNKLTLYADMVCKDTTAVGSSKPFANAQIFNIGQFSLVLQTGDTNPYYTSTQVRTVTRYGFIRQKTTSTN
ncbi:hypothetical protein FFF34_010430 [Inquilinus sp. KBS0705]|nr:hypothetical protein FFF34_010430 [Inquilinus sp. KBS0705]